MERIWVVEVKGYGLFGCKCKDSAELAVNKLIECGEKQVTYYSIEIYDNATAIVSEALHVKRLEET